MPLTIEELVPGGVEDVRDLNAILAAVAAYVNRIEESSNVAGDLKATARSSAPAGWLICDGAAVSRTTYQTLFDAIGTTYGAGDGSTTFNLPDLRGRVPVGVDGAAARLTASDALGQAAGAEKHTLTLAEMPSHRHSISPLSLASNSSPAGAGNSYPVDAGSTFTDFQGGGGAHNNMPPYQIVNWVVKT